MEVKTIQITKVKPYPQNPRKNDGAVDAVAKSLREYGWQQPIVVDKDMVVIAGHTRLKAAKKLGMKEVPVVIASGLTEKQVKAYRLADNKVGELAEWDDDLLLEELKALDNYEVPGFEDFDLNMGVVEEETPDDRDPSCQHNAFENQDLKQFPIESYYGIPAMKSTKVKGDKLLRFMDWRTVEESERKDYIAHFYYDDYKFIAAWREPDKYIERLKQFKAVITPDFSLYTDFPRALQILSCYRRQWCGAYWQEQGLKVIPDVVWGDKDSYDYCFDGIPKGGTVAVSTVGVRNDETWNGKIDNMFLDGYNEMLNRLNPSTIIVYGSMIEGLEGNIISVPSYYMEKSKEWRSNGKRNE